MEKLTTSIPEDITEEKTRALLEERLEEAKYNPMLLEQLYKMLKYIDNPDFVSIVDTGFSVVDLTHNSHEVNNKIDLYKKLALTKRISKKLLRTLFIYRGDEFNFYSPGEKRTCFHGALVSELKNSKDNPLSFDHRYGFSDGDRLEYSKLHNLVTTLGYNPDDFPSTMTRANVEKWIKTIEDDMRKHGQSVGVPYVAHMNHKR